MKNERKEELKNEMKNRISLALKDPILQQGFEIICKENAELRVKFLQATDEGTSWYHLKSLERENAELKDKLNIRSCQNCRNYNRTCLNDGSCKNYSKWEGYKNSQLTKAKEIIKRLLCVVRNHLCIADISFNILINDAEKILKEE